MPEPKQEEIPLLTLFVTEHTRQVSSSILHPPKFSAAVSPEYNSRSMYSEFSTEQSPGAQIPLGPAKRRGETHGRREGEGVR
ncbi:hypothetical protein RRG08_011852 [Elysia crispata]|uniref:Uncharacterized protein n=1 Tax=Elysia crispata TaxID=231223 RepID=A0AAE0ZM41_9GAST|nr:hypothetical protein RRG08_011852 [Elysia crispata]